MDNEPMKPMRRGWVLLALMLTMMLAAMDTTIVATATPQIVGDLGGFSLFSWLFSIYLLVQTITIPIYGKLADLFGRKPVLMIGVSIFLLGSATCAAAWNMPALILFRGLQAVGAGAIMASVNTIAGDIFTVRERAKVQGWLSSVWGISAIVGPALGGAFADYASWRWIFLINIPIGAGALALLAVFFHEDKPHTSHHIDWKGALAVLIAGSSLIFGLLEGGHSWPWLSYQTLVMAVIAGGAIFIVFRVEKRAVEPMLPGWVWSHRAILGANIGAMGMGAILMGPNMFLPVLAQTVTGVSAMIAGFILASESLTWPFFSSLSGKLYLHIGFRNTAICGTLIVIAGATSFLFIPFPASMGRLILTQLILGAGFGLMTTPLIVGVQSMVPWEKRGVVTGTNIFSRYIGQSVGSAIFAAIFNTILLSQFTSAPPEIQAHLPDINKVLSTLQSHQSAPEVNFFLQNTFFHAAHGVYTGMVGVGVATLIVLLLTPSNFNKIQDEE